MGKINFDGNVLKKEFRFLFSQPFFRGICKGEDLSFTCHCKEKQSNIQKSFKQFCMTDSTKNCKIFVKYFFYSNVTSGIFLAFGFSAKRKKNNKTILCIWYLSDNFAFPKLKFYLSVKGFIAPSSKISVSFLMEHIFFALTNLNFCPTVEKFYYLPILLKMFIGAAEPTHSKSFKASNCSIVL